jgi:hypothetical protein
MDATPANDPRRDLEVLLASQCPLVLIETREEARAIEVVRGASLRVNKSRGWPILQWTLTDGLARIDLEVEGPAGTTLAKGGSAQRTIAEPEALLRRIKGTASPGIYLLLDFHPFLDSPLHVRLIKDIAQSHGAAARTLVFVSHELKLPVELEHLAARLPLQLPGKPERQMIVMRAIEEWTDRHHGKAPIVEPKAAAALADNLAGLTASDAMRLARQALFNDGALGMADVSAAQSNKYRLLNRGGVLSYEPDTGGFALVGGLKRLREWLTRRRPAFEAAAKLDAPKGLLLIGVQGCGKSLAAKAAAGLFGVPLLRLDVGSIFSKWHGESEKNLRDSLAAAESLAPCVLWIDEIEKAFATGDNDGGTTRRVLGGFLTWLSEKRARVFVVATANEIAALPPELVRKGRFDEIFFVDLPDAAARAEILQIHARRRGITLDAAASTALAARAEGFSGAELEQAVVSAAYHVHDASSPPDARAIARELANTQPLSVVMAEKIDALRAWAAERTVPAD